MASVLHNETLFEDPLTFKPQRYLEGDIALKKQRTIPFSIGMETLPKYCFAAIVKIFISCVTLITGCIGVSLTLQL